ncbi:MAG: type II toxin-antitoxin system VapC family toxin [Theionarchaea archaeon]|nr:type II toxin-antitoxin system VapC family toxin [Theionarchaea archaeon]
MNYIDVNVFVYWLTNDRDFGETATTIIRGIELGEKASTSALALWQLHILLKKESKNYSERMLTEKISKLKNLSILPLILKDFRDALAYQKMGLDLEDSLHYDTANRVDAAFIYSNDTDFDNLSIERKFE